MKHRGTPWAALLSVALCAATLGSARADEFARETVDAPHLEEALKRARRGGAGVGGALRRHVEAEAALASTPSGDDRYDALARALLSTHGYADADNCLREAQEQAEKARAWPTASALVRCRLDLAKEVENLDKALRLARTQVDLARRTRDPRDEVGAFIDLGALCGRLDRLSAALDCHEQSAALLQGSPEPALLASSHANLAAIHQLLGEREGALLHAQAALAAARTADDAALEAACLERLGRVQAAFGDADGAEVSCSDALALFEALGLEMEAAHAMGCLGAARLARGEAREALPLLEQDLTARDVAGDTRAAGKSHVDVGDAWFLLDDFDRAEDHYAQALAAARRTGSRRLQASALGRLARTHLQNGDAEAALGAAERSTQILGELLFGLASEEGALARAVWALPFETGVAAALALDDVGAAFRLLERGRAATLLESLGIRLDEAIEVPQDLRAAEAIAQLRERDARQNFKDARAEGDLATTRERRAELAKAQTEARDAAARIERWTKAHRSPDATRNAVLSSVAEHLAPGEALVLYAWLRPASLAVVVTRDGGRLVRLPSATTLADACDAMDLEDRDADPTESIAALRRLVVDPLDLGSEIEHVLLSPDGRLAEVAFAVLLDDRRLSLVPSASTWMALLDAPTVRGEGVLAIGDAIPGPRTRGAEPAAPPPEIVERGDRRAPALPAARREIEEVADLALTGRTATEDTLARVLATGKRWRALHVSCHGQVDAERPMHSSLTLTPDAHNDGYLTALEVVGMHVPADMVVLSACDTGRGRIYPIEGKMSFARAFLRAGAPRVVVSLWRVPDEATSVLMTAFHEYWNPRDPDRIALGAAEALRRAQADVRAEPGWEHPYYWAAWVLWGLAD